MSAVQAFENTVGKGEIARKEQFLLFPTVFPTLSENSLPFSSNLKLSSANAFSPKSLKFVVWERVNSTSIYGARIFFMHLLTI